MPDPIQPPPRRPYRPPVGMPLPKQNRAASAVASVLLHALILLFVLGPLFVHDALQAASQGAGGPGPAGGGGGGSRRRGSLVQERVRFVEVRPPPPSPTVKPLVPPLEIKKPEPEPPKPEPPKAQPPEALKDAPPAIGAGNVGNGGTTGAGPGTGGGVGSGEGTGRGSSRGPGTGGGPGRIYPPTVTHLAILPMPIPPRVKPYKVVACFEVDEKGNAKLLSWNPSRDSDYNKRVKAFLEEVRFRPATDPDGVPVKVKTCDFSAEATL